MIAGPLRLLTRFGRSLAPVKVFSSEDDGSVAIEYGLIAAFVVVVIIVTLVQLGNDLISLPLPTLNAAFDEALQ